jgi:hypothetical protein
MNSEQLVFASTDFNQPGIEFTNGVQFDALRSGTPLVLFYTEGVGDDQPIFDPENDEQLYQLHADPFEVKSLEIYEACVTRAHYDCKLHPDQEAALELVRASLPSLDPDTLVFVYRRDSAGSSLVANRRSNPFQNPYNGIRAGAPSEELILFAQNSFEPFVRATIIWQLEPRPNSTVGLFAIQVTERLQ